MGRQHESKAGSRENGTKELLEKFRYPCPMAKETGCTRMYTVSETATNHANCVHRELGHSCPMAKATRCTKIFTTSKDAKTHANSVHRKMRHPCPMAEETGCKSTFSDPRNATKHARYVHKGITFPCPFAESVGCDARFSYRRNAKVHADAVHLGLRFPCPLAEEFGCTKTLHSRGAAKEHADSEHRGKKYPCSDCQEKFGSREHMREHRDSVHRAWICAVPLCRMSVTKRVLSYKKFPGHMRQHEELGQLDGLTTYPHPIMVDRTNIPLGSAETRLDQDNGSSLEDEDNDDGIDGPSSITGGNDGDLALYSRVLYSEIMDDMEARKESVRKRNEELLRLYPEIQPVNLGLHYYITHTKGFVEGLVCVMFCWYCTSEESKQERSYR